MSSQIAKGLFRGLGVVGLCLAFLWPGSREVKAKVDLDPPNPPTTDTCIGCHPEIGEDWASHAHGQAATNEAFTQAWNEQGNLPVCMTCHATGYDEVTSTWESPGVSCLTCHGPYNDKHPDEIMPTDVNTRVCGNCHLQTYLEFEDSAHAQTGQNCYDCHNAHTTSLKTENSEELCQTCHRERVHSFELTAHAANGLQCSDCHLEAEEVSDLGMGHGTRNHTFKAGLETCLGCHAESLHSPLQVAVTYTQTPEEGLANSFPSQPSLKTEPLAANLVGFVIVGPLVGLGVGMVIAPWLENWVRRLRNKE